MVIGKMKPVATIVAQFAAGVEVEAIQHEGKMFLPVMGLGEFAASDDAPEKPARPAKKAEPAPDAEDEKAPAKKSEAKGKQYTKDELMEMESKELVKILKNDFGINPDDFDGKNTNKKLRDLILDAQKNGGKKSDDEDTEDEKPAKKSPAKKSAKDEDEDGDGDGDSDDTVTKVGDILEEFDEGKKNKKKTVAAILALADGDVDEDKITELVEGFEEDGDADIDETAEKIADVLSGKKPAKAAPKSRKAKKEEKEELVDPEDLEKGDRVSVWWDDEDNKAWYDGTVKSIKKGVVTIAYDDDTEDEIDPEVHTKIKRLAE